MGSSSNCAVTMALHMQSLFLPLAAEGVGLSVATHRPPGEDGYFMLTLSPGRVLESPEPRDVTVVMDVSGSMSGEKIEQARAALRGLLGTLARGGLGPPAPSSPEPEGGWTP